MHARARAVALVRSVRSCEIIIVIARIIGINIRAGVSKDSAS